MVKYNTEHQDRARLRQSSLHNRQQGEDSEGCLRRHRRQYKQRLCPQRRWRRKRVCRRKHSDRIGQHTVIELHRRVVLEQILVPRLQVVQAHLAQASHP
jgi:hypothetical protein